MVDPLSYFSFQPMLHDWCNKGMCYPVYGMVHIKEPLLLIKNVLALNVHIKLSESKSKTSMFLVIVKSINIGLSRHYVDLVLNYLRVDVLT